MAPGTKEGKYNYPFPASLPTPFGTKYSKSGGVVYPRGLLCGSKVASYCTVESWRSLPPRLA